VHHDCCGCLRQCSGVHCTMTITINETTYSGGVWTVVAVVDGDKGTFVGPFVLSLTEDATINDMIAAIQAVF